MTGPLYPRIAFVVDPRTVWDMLEGGWEWLGSDDEGEFVLGYPRRDRPTRTGIGITMVEPGAKQPDHGVRVDTALAPATNHWYVTETKAKDEFLRIVDELRRERQGEPSLTLVQRIEKAAVVDEMFVVIHGRAPARPLRPLAARASM